MGDGSIGGGAGAYWRLARTLRPNLTLTLTLTLTLALYPNPNQALTAGHSP